MNEIQIQTTINEEVLNREIVIINQTDYEGAGDVLKLCKNKLKDLEIERKGYTQPLDESKKRIMARFKEITDPIDAYITKISAKMSEWYVIEEKKRTELQKQLEAEAIKNADDKNPDVIVPIVESAKTIRGNVATTTMIERWEFEIDNPIDVPKEYWIVDEKKIGEAVRSGVREIAGVRIYKIYKPNSR